MKKLILIALMLVVIAPATAQQDTLTNGDFERWESSGKPAPFDWQEPRNWTSSNGLTEFIGAAVTKTQMQGTGSFQAKLRTLNVFGEPVPAVLINGDFAINLSDTAKLPLLGGMPDTVAKPHLYGMYNFVNTDTTDSAMVVVIFKKFNTATQQPEAIAGGTKILPATGPGLHPFVVDVYTLAQGTPDSVVVTITSSKVNNFKFGGELIVDYVTFENPNTAWPPVPLPDDKIYLYPNPAAAGDKVTVVGSSFLNYEVMNTLGAVVATGHSTIPVSEIDITSLPAGVYFVRFGARPNETLRFIKQ